MDGQLKNKLIIIFLQKIMKGKKKCILIHILKDSWKRILT